MVDIKKLSDDTKNSIKKALWQLKFAGVFAKTEIEAYINTGEMPEIVFNALNKVFNESFSKDITKNVLPTEKEINKSSFTADQMIAVTTAIYESKLMKQADKDSKTVSTINNKDVIDLATRTQMNLLEFIDGTNKALALLVADRTVKPYPTMEKDITNLRSLIRTATKSYIVLNAIATYNSANALTPVKDMLIDQNDLTKLNEAISHFNKDISPTATDLEKAQHFAQGKTIKDFLSKISSKGDIANLNKIDTGLDTIKRRLTDLEVRQVVLEGQQKTTNAEIEAIKSKQNELIASGNATTTEIAELKEHQTQLENALNKTNDELKNVQKQQTDAKKELDETNSSIKKVEQKQEEQTKRHEALEERITTAEKNQATYDGRLKEIDDKQIEYDKKQGEFEVELNNLKEQHSKDKQELTEKIVNVQIDLDKKIVSIEDEQKANKTKHSELEGKLSTLETKQAEDVAKLTDQLNKVKSDDIAERQKITEQINAVKTDFEENKKAVNNEINEVKTKQDELKAEIDNSRKEATEKSQELETKIAELDKAYGKDKAEILNQIGELNNRQDDLVKEQKEIRSLTRENERQISKLKAQNEDIIESIADLTEESKKLKATAKQHTKDIDALKDVQLDIEGRQQTLEEQNGLIVKSVKDANKRLDGVVAEQATLAQRHDDLASRYEEDKVELADTISEIRDTLSEYKDAFDEIKRNQEAMAERQNVTDSNVTSNAQRIAEVDGNVNAGFAEINGKFQAISSQLQGIVARLDNLPNFSGSNGNNPPNGANPPRSGDGRTITPPNAGGNGGGRIENPDFDDDNDSDNGDNGVPPISGDIPGQRDGGANDAPNRPDYPGGNFGGERRMPRESEGRPNIGREGGSSYGDGLEPYTAPNASGIPGVVKSAKTRKVSRGRRIINWIGRHWLLVAMVGTAIGLGVSALIGPAGAAAALGVARFGLFNAATFGTIAGGALLIKYATFRKKRHANSAEIHLMKREKKVQGKIRKSELNVKKIASIQDQIKNLQEQSTKYSIKSRNYKSLAKEIKNLRKEQRKLDNSNILLLANINNEFKPVEKLGLIDRMFYRVKAATGHATLNEYFQEHSKYIDNKTYHNPDKANKYGAMRLDGNITDEDLSFQIVRRKYSESLKERMQEIANDRSKKKDFKSLKSYLDKIHEDIIPKKGDVRSEERQILGVVAKDIVAEQDETDFEVQKGVRAKEIHIYSNSSPKSSENPQGVYTGEAAVVVTMPDGTVKTYGSEIGKRQIDIERRRANGTLPQNRVPNPSDIPSNTMNGENSAERGGR